MSWTSLNLFRSLSMCSSGSTSYSSVGWRGLPTTASKGTFLPNIMRFGVLPILGWTDARYAIMIWGRYLSHVFWSCSRYIVNMVASVRLNLATQPLACGLILLVRVLSMWRISHISLKAFDSKFLPGSECICRRVPNLQRISFTNAVIIVCTSWSLIAVASIH